MSDEDRIQALAKSIRIADRRGKFPRWRRRQTWGALRPEHKAHYVYMARAIFAEMPHHLGATSYQYGIMTRLTYGGEWNGPYEKHPVTRSPFTYESATALSEHSTSAFEYKIVRRIVGDEWVEA